MAKEITNIEEKVGSDGTVSYWTYYDDGTHGVSKYKPVTTAYNLQKGIGQSINTASSKSQAEIQDMLDQYGYQTTKNMLQLDRIGYEDNSDYQSMIDYAVSKGNTEAAAWFEKQRNQKIADMNAKGTNTGGYTQTNLYSQYYNPQTLSPSYARYLEKAYAKTPTTYTDATISEGIQKALASLEAAGKYDEANQLRMEWLYKKNYDTGEFEQLAQPDWRGYTSEEWAKMNADNSYAANNFRVTGGAAGNDSMSIGDYDALVGGLNFASGPVDREAGSFGGGGLADGLSKGQKVTYTDVNGELQKGYIQPQGSYLDTLHSQLQQMYQESLKNNDSSYAAQLKQALSALELQGATAEQQYDDMAQQLYVERMMQQKNLPQQLAAMGYGGGLTESSLLDVQRNYEQNFLDNELARRNAQQQLSYQQVLAETENELERLQAAGQLDQNYYTQLANLMAQMQAQANYEAEMQFQKEQAAQAQANYEAELALQQQVAAQEQANLDREWRYQLALAEQELAAQKRAAQTSETYNYTPQPVEKDYSGLFEAAYQDKSPANFISSNYKKYGFTSSSGLTQAYDDWVSDRAKGGTDYGWAGYDAIKNSVLRNMSEGNKVVAKNTLKAFWDKLSAGQQSELVAAINGG